MIRTSFHAPHKKYLGEYLYHTSTFTDNLTFRLDEYKHHLMRDMRERLADFVMNAKVEHRPEGEFRTETRMSVYVLNPNDIEELIENEIELRLRMRDSRL